MAAGLAYEYLEYGKLSRRVAPPPRAQDVDRLAHFPMVFVRGVLVGGADDVAKLIEKGELGKKRSESGQTTPPASPAPLLKGGGDDCRK